MRVFKWSPAFHVDKEPSVVPVWFQLPKLPLHYFQKEAIFQISSVLGIPLFVDAATSAVARPSLARVCVEIDLLQPRPSRIWIGNGNYDGFWQDLVPENIPKYCPHCFRQGHGVDDCHVRNPALRPPKVEGQRRDRQPMAAEGGPRQREEATQKGEFSEGPAVVMEAAQGGGSAEGSAVAKEVVQGGGKSEGPAVAKEAAQGGANEEGPAVAKESEGVWIEVGVERVANGAVGQNQGIGHQMPLLNEVIGEGSEAPGGEPMKSIDMQAHARRNEQESEPGLEQVRSGRQVEQQGVASDSCEEEFEDDFHTMAGSLSPRLVFVREREAVSTLDALNIVWYFVMINTLLWNIRGVSKLPNLRRLKSISKEKGVQFVAISEPKLEASRVEDIRLKLAFDFAHVNDSGDLWILYKYPFNCSVLGNSTQHISLMVSHPWLPGSMIFSFVHAACTEEGRRELWANLLLDKPQALPWCIGGDFNVIVEASEKKGGRPFAVSEGVDFLAFMQDAEVFDAGCSGSRFSWCNNRRGRARIWKRLDRLLMNGEMAEAVSVISVVHLARHPSDHAPLHVSFTSRLDNGARPFRFLNIWTTKPELLDVIRGAWVVDVHGSPLRVLCLKLQATRRAIQHWKNQKFGSVGNAVREAENRLARIEGSVETSRLEEEDPAELNMARADLSRALAVEEQFWRQKARVKWLGCGDRNTRFFHAVVKQRRVQGAIHRVKDSNGSWVDRDEDIAQVAVEYFSNLFSGPVDTGGGDLMHLIPKLVSDEENERLAAIPSMEEIRHLVFSMDGESAAGPDGFTGKFFSFAWEVVAQDVYKAVVSFFCGSHLPKFLTSTSIVLLPKVSNPQDFSNFRPISLCNFCNKLLSKLLVSRMALVLPKLISPQQTGFVKGRSISDNYLLAQELMASIGKKARGGNVALKLDMTKAYDRMSWFHVISMLRAFGFCEQIIDMIWRLISNVWFSIIINGSAQGFFKSSRGLRQGDPLSPVLFVIGSKLLSRGLNELASRRNYIGFRVPTGCQAITHLAFADDILVFTNGSSMALQQVKRVIEKYQQSSGQLVNPQKSGYLVHPSISPSRRRVIERLTHFSRQDFPIRYLGFPLYSGRGKAAYFGEVCQSVVARVMSWKSRLLSTGGKLVLIKHVLSAIPVHLLSAAVGFGSVFRQIEQVCARFLWGSSGQVSKFQWISWPQLCLAVDEGGVGIRKLSEVYSAFSCKLWWNLRAGTSLWAEFMRAKYCKGQHPCQVEIKRQDSMTWKRMVNISRQTELSMVWLVKGGSCNFWYDNWLGSGALCLKVLVISELSFRDFISNGSWDWQRLRSVIPAELIYSFSQQPVPEGEEQDELVWRHTVSGRFSLASAFQEVRRASHYSVLHSRVWHSWLPLKISFFMTRLLLGKLPVTAALGRVGVHLASKCLCCLEGAEETLDHVFSEGDIAREVWEFFGRIGGVSRRGIYVRSWLAAWWMSHPRAEEGRFLFGIIPSFICWHIWKGRNRAIFEGVPMSHAKVCHDILQDLEGVAEGKFHQRVGRNVLFQFLGGLATSPQRFYAQAVSWRAPEGGTLILNTDGCAKGNPGASGGGGQRGYTDVTIQVDSQVLVGILQRRVQCPWQVRVVVEQIWGLIPDAGQVSHCYREANRVADRLANVGVTRQIQSIITYENFDELPALARGEIRCDRIGIPSIRRRQLKRNTRLG
ncbi:uncharacterized protein [Coffea arabica]|uniref:Reverse transcriptase domain-containing protein n=1 Tax=Coffea arabica TaxID=13443 RepID=A0A6P6WYK0_COFAR